ncbi:MAG: BamA/TamA family outer membrane protein [Acidobacteriota bacterium]
MYWLFSTLLSVPLANPLLAQNPASPQPTQSLEAPRPEFAARSASVDTQASKEALAGDSTSASDPSTNVNARYIIESVSLKKNPSKKLSNNLQSEFSRLAGQHMDHSLLEKVAAELKEELHVPDVRIHVDRGQAPESVTVMFEVVEHQAKFDLDVSRFLYHSKQGWTGEGNITIHPHGNAITFGLVSDGDRLSERYAGIQAAFERKQIGTSRLGIRFRFTSYHEQWNRTTLAAAAPSDIYRSRQNFVPEATFVLFEPLQFSFGVDFARYRVPTLNPVALGFGERTASSNAVVSTLRYHQRWGAENSKNKQDRNQQEWTADYIIRSATRNLESDSVFTKQQADAKYRLKRGPNQVEIGFHTGHISGYAPLFERFIVGNAETLRGWNKFDIAPTGSSNLMHGSIDYRFDNFLMFYDTGAAWTLSSQREQKQSLGLGFQGGGLELAVAFPVRAGHANPVFYIGVNF